MKVVIPAPCRGDAWMGGANYFRSLAQALRAHPPSDGSTVSILTNDSELFGKRKEGCVDIIDAPWLDATARVDHFVNGALNTLCQYNPRLYRYARSINADLITHATPGWASPCPILFWMPDFQHRHLPDYFSAYERWRRNRNVRATSRHGHILLSSRSAATDFRRFYPDQQRTAPHVLSFPSVGNDVHLAPKHELLAKYELDDGFFFLPNQFWKHKNHRIVLEALHGLPEHFKVVSTGAIMDSRGNEHIHALRNAIERYSLQRRFRILGVLPRHDMLSLMHHSLCVINPSLFEGWSTVVEEAKLAGKRLILSDIPVHREQDPADAIFFDANDPDALPAAMRKIFEEHDPDRDQVRAAGARGAFGSAVARFAEEYWRIARTSAGMSEP